MSADARPRSRSPLPAWAFYAALVVIFLAPSQLAYTRDPKHGPFIGYADVLAGLVCLAAAVAYLLFSGRRAQYEPASDSTGEAPESAERPGLICPPLAVWALVAVSALSLSQANDLKSGLIDTVQWGLYLVAVYMVFVNVLRDRRRLQTALLVLAVSTTLVVGWALAQYLQTPLPDGSGAAELQEAQARVGAGFTNRNTYSAFLALVLPLALAGAVHLRRWGWRVWLAILVAVGLVTMLSGPLVWVTVLALAMVALSGRGATRAVTLVALGAFVGLMLGTLPRNYHAVVTEQLDPYEPVVLKVVWGPEASKAPPQVIKKRWLEWIPALRMLSAHPALGVGAGNYQANIGQYYEGGDSGGWATATLPNVKKSEPDTNNLYLVIAGSTGLCGLAALLGVLSHFWRRGRQLRSVSESTLGRVLAGGLPAALLALLLGNLFTAMFVRGLSLVVVLLFALAEAGRYAERRRWSVEREGIGRPAQTGTHTAN